MQLSRDRKLSASILLKLTINGALTASIFTYFSGNSQLLTSATKLLTNAT